MKSITEDKFISIIIPMFNSEETISRTIDSILAQTYKNFEIIIVNDGSTDNSKEIVESYKKSYKNIILINDKNFGPSHARNIGIKKSKYDYIMFIDADDTIEKTCLTDMVKYLDDYDLVISGFTRILSNKKITYVPKLNSNNTEEFLIKNHIFWSPCFKLFNKNLISNYFDESLVISEDLKFWVYNAKNFNRFKYIEKSYYNYYLNFQSSTALKRYGTYEEKSLDEMIKLTNVCSVPQYIKQYFLDNYFEYKYRIKKLKLNSEYIKYKNKYNKVAKRYYYDVLKSNLSLKIKIKNIIKYRLNYLFNIIKK